MAIWNILWTFGIFYNHLVHSVFIWNIFPVLVPCTKKDLATLVEAGHLRQQKSHDRLINSPGQQSVTMKLDA
jgi:hypothetical protein